MRASQFLLKTTKDDPAEAEIVSHRLMLRSGMIKKVAAGLYSWLPVGLRVFRKVESIVRDEMNKSGAMELLMPTAQPSDLWEESGRWNEFGPELMRFQDRHQRDFCLGPTHEEVITDIVRNEISSYKQLPVNLYQINTKFRDERRPRFGVMRTREFCMKDAYSFHSDEACLANTYQTMHDTYSNIFKKFGLKFRAVIADTGSIGGNSSHEFMVLAESGEDAIAFSDSSDYAANLEKAISLTEKPNDSSKETEKSSSVTATPNIKTIDQLTNFLKIDVQKTIKTLVVKNITNDKETFYALVLRGDHQLNEVKTKNHLKISGDLQFASDDEIKTLLGCHSGSIGPINLDVNLIIDTAAQNVKNFVCGANEDDKHIINANWSEVSNFETADIRNVLEGDLSPDGKGKIQIKRGIEVGHIFQLGTKYSESMRAKILDENGKDKLMHMGCYGIGIGRIVAAAIEQNNDEKGIIWPDSLAPFLVVIVPINLHKSELVRKTSEDLYNALQNSGYDTLLMDQENKRLGSMLADVELIGIPHIVVIGERDLNDGYIEYKQRLSSESRRIKLEETIKYIADEVQIIK